MTRKFTAMLAAAAVALTALAPSGASAQRWRDGYGHDGRGPDAYGCVDDDNYGCERDRDRRLARRGYRNGYGGYDRGDYGYGYDCYDRYGRNHCYNDRRRDDDDDDAVVAGVVGLVLGAVIGSAITSGNQRNDGYQRDRCTRQERRWDRSAQRYYTVNVPC